MAQASDNDLIPLVADIGGSEARFACLDGTGAPGPVHSLPVGAYAGFESALEHVLAGGLAPGPPDTLAVCAAGPLHAGRIQLTNASWCMDHTQLQNLTTTGRAYLVNDFSAMALSLPVLGRQSLLAHGTQQPIHGEPMVVLGPGTGLGVAGCVRGSDGHYVPVPGEGGHVSLAPASARETQVVERLIERFGHASAERAVSGTGLPQLYRVVAELDGVFDKAAPPLHAAQIAARAFAHTDATAVETLALFTAWLGSLAGDLALTLGAKGGVFLGGGILPKWHKQFDVERFRARFSAKGRCKDYLEAIPSSTIIADGPALLGLAQLLKQAP